MEAIGAASAILAFLTFAAKATAQIYEVYDSFKEAQETVFRTTRDLRDLTRILEHILDILIANDGRNGLRPDEDGPSRNGHAQVLESLMARDDNPVVACRAEITGILGLLHGHRITWPARKKDIEKHLVNIERLKSQLGLAMQSQSMAAILGIERVLESHASLLQKHVQDQENRDALAWLNAPDAWRNLRTALAKRQQGTGDWLISSSTFQTWLSVPQFLWVNGIPGAGKTILSSTIIASLLCQQEETPNNVIFSYFDFQDMSKQKADTLLRVLLAQLAIRNSAAMRCLRDLYNELWASGSGESSPSRLLNALTTALAASPRTYVVVDALDECSDRRELARYLKALAELTNVHIVALSRRERDIELALRGIALDVPLTATTMDGDIALYIKHRMEASEDMMFWSPEDRKKVQDHLISKAGGMFRWAQCQLDALEACGSSEEIDEVLISLPKDLPDTYERILARLDGRQAMNVRLILVSLMFARRPLTKDELTDILRININGKPRMKCGSVYWNPLLMACSSLISVSSPNTDGDGPDGTAVLRLAHFSVKEYLVSDNIKRGKARVFSMSPGMGHRIMAELCLGCLLHHDDYLTFGPDSLKQHPFTRYAALNWSTHCRQSNEEENDRTVLDKLSLEFLHGGSGDAYFNWLFAERSWEAKTRRRWYQIYREGFSRSKPQTISMTGGELVHPLVCAAGYNLWRAVEMVLIALRGEANASYQPVVEEAMLAAVRKGAVRTMETIFRVEGSMDLSSLPTGNQPLLYTGYPGVVKWLMAHGADPYDTRGYMGTPIQFQAMRGYHRALAALMELGADPEATFEHTDPELVLGSWTPLQCAADVSPLTDSDSIRTIECLDILLRHGAAINRISGRRGSCLHVASVAGDLRVFHYLLEKGADIQAVSEQYGSVLWAAGFGQNRELVRACLEKGLRWDECIDTTLEATRSRNWEDLDTETQEALIERVIKVSLKRQSDMTK